MRINIDLSPNFSNKNRKKKDIHFVILHYTGMQSAIESLNRLKDRNSKVSCHYLIDKKGSVTQLVPENKIAWHAGKSKWKRFINLNNNSIGIELQNKGHKYGYENFSYKQIKNLVKLCHILKKKYKIDNNSFLGHSDIAPLRKKDPGEKFPWQKLNRLKIGLWYTQKNLNSIKFKNNIDPKNLFFRNLYIIGYRYFKINFRDKKKDRMIIKAFQRKFLPKNVNGRIDEKTLRISQFLAIKSKFT